MNDLSSFKEVALHGFIDGGRVFQVFYDGLYDPGPVLLDIDSIGGSLWFASRLVDFIKAREEPVVARLHGVYSAAAWIASVCDSVIVDDSSEFMIHASRFLEPESMTSYEGYNIHHDDRMIADVATASGHPDAVVRTWLNSETTWKGRAIITALGLKEFGAVEEGFSVGTFLSTFRREAASRTITEPWTPAPEPGEEPLDYLTRTAIHQNRLRKAAEARRREAGKLW